MRWRVTETTSLEEALARRFPGASRTSRRQWIRFGRVLVNGRAALSPRESLASGDEVTLGARRTTPFPPELRLVHRDEDLLVVDKPAGLLTATTPGERRTTALKLVQDWCAEVAPDCSARLVHRLDRDASGLLVFALSDAAFHWLKEDFRAHRVRRVYTVVVRGRMEPAEGMIQSWLENRGGGPVASGEEARGGQLSVTHWKVDAATDTASRLTIVLGTGRRNQIRVHMKDLGHPVLGDRTYGGERGDGVPRLLLHAAELELRHPRTGELLTFRAPAPPVFRTALREQRDAPAGDAS